MHTTSPAPHVGGSRAPALAAYAYAALAAAALAHFLLQIPIQLTDSFGNMLALDTSWRELMEGQFYQRGYLRPFVWGMFKAVYDASGGNYFAWFRGVHVLQVALLLMLYVHVVRPRTWKDAAVVPLGIAVLIGGHTFAGTVFEAFPINAYLTMLVYGFAAVALSMAPHRWWNDVLAVLMFAVAVLTFEGGLLIWVVLVSCAIVGMKGLSRPGLVALTLALAGYFVLRFAVLDIGSPGLSERSSGYGFRALDPAELIARFGDNPLPFYAYNVVTSFATVLFAEPRGGVFRLVWALTHEPEPALVINAIASTLATVLIVRYGWRRRRDWFAWRLDRRDQFVLLFLMVLIANAVVSFPYTKDIIMSPAGSFLALAVYAVVGDAIDSLPALPGGRASVLGAMLVVLAATWTIRDAGIHVRLHTTALSVRREWAYADQWLLGQRIDVREPGVRRLYSQLWNDAVATHPAPLAAARLRWFDVD